MSRPCFALSVMLSGLAFSLVAVEKTHGTEDAISPSHAPSECIVCPLAHGPSTACADLLCADYSDYDYNDYRLDEDPAPLPPADHAEPELATADEIQRDESEEAAIAAEDPADVPELD